MEGNNRRRATSPPQAEVGKGGNLIQVVLIGFSDAPAQGPAPEPTLRPCLFRSQGMTTWLRHHVAHLPVRLGRVRVAVVADHTSLGRAMSENMAVWNPSSLSRKNCGSPVRLISSKCSVCWPVNLLASLIGKSEPRKRYRGTELRRRPSAVSRRKRAGSGPASSPWSCQSSSNRIP